MINIKLRLQNKATLTALILQVISIVYMILSACGVTPHINQELVIGIAQAIIGVLVLIGVVVDPTTQGIGDSEQALEYEEPKEK